MLHKYFINQNSHVHIDTYFEIISIPKDEGHKDLILPDCTPGLMFIEKGKLSRRDGRENSILRRGAIYLFGQKTKAVEYRFYKAGLRAYGVKLKPSSVSSLFGIKASEITDCVLDVKELLRNIDPYIEPFFEHPSSNSSCFERLLSLLNRNRQNNDQDLLNALLEDIHQAKGDLSIHSLTRKYHIGYKRIERLFKQHVGLTPKLYARIIRFNQSVKYGMGSAVDRLTDVAYHGGFFDQNHFIKETKQFTGRIPSEIFGLSHSFVEPEHLSYLRQRGY